MIKRALNIVHFFLVWCIQPIKPNVFLGQPLKWGYVSLMMRCLSCEHNYSFLLLLVVFSFMLCLFVWSIAQDIFHFCVSTVECVLDPLHKRSSCPFCRECAYFVKTSFLKVEHRSVSGTEAPNYLWIRPCISHPQLQWAQCVRMGLPVVS